jgi:type I restriction enzyme, S subunit
MGGQTAGEMVEFEALKPGWQRVKFGDVVRLGNTRCSDPAAKGIERYIGLEHINSDDLRIRRWGLVEDGITFNTLFKPRQVLFGKRRAYQRKVAVADFEGICSGDIYVLETANPKVLLPELLPFICQTDRFFEYAIGTSAGSLSPRTNWKSLMNFEFALPPIEEQEKMVKILMAFTSTESEIRNLVESINTLREASFISIFSAFTHLKAKESLKEINDICIPVGWRLVKVDELSKAIITKGATPSRHITDKSTGIPFLKVYNLTFDGTLDFTHNPTFISEAGQAELERSIILEGDILINIVGPPLGKVSVIPPGFPKANINQAIARYRPHNNEIRKWLCWYLQSAWAKSWFLKHSKKTSGQRNLTLELCRELPVPLPPHEQFSKFIEDIDRIENAKKAAEMRLMEISRQIHTFRSLMGW